MKKKNTITTPLTPEMISELELSRWWQEIPDSKPTKLIYVTGCVPYFPPSKDVTWVGHEVTVKASGQVTYTDMTNRQKGVKLAKNIAPEDCEDFLDDMVRIISNKATRENYRFDAYNGKFKLYFEDGTVLKYGCDLRLKDESTDELVDLFLDFVFGEPDLNDPSRWHHLRANRIKRMEYKHEIIPVTSRSGRSKDGTLGFKITAKDSGEVVLSRFEDGKKIREDKKELILEKISGFTVSILDLVTGEGSSKMEIDDDAACSFKLIFEDGTVMTFDDGFYNEGETTEDIMRAFVKDVFGNIEF